MRVVLNLGLNNNPASLDSIATIFKPFGLKLSQKRLGIYEGNQEPTFVGVFSWFQGASVSLIEVTMRLMCEVFTQECIAFKVYEGDKVHKFLVYHKDFKGEKYSFSDEFFLDFDVTSEFTIH